MRGSAGQVQGRPVVVVGAGLAGLSCAMHLTVQGLPCVVLEASDQVGGRVRTDDVDGFRLDRGFQVFQTAYPEARQLLDYDALDLKQLEPGALIRKGQRWVRMSDPWRRPQHALGTLFNSIGSLADRMRLLRLRRDALAGDLESLLNRSQDQSTESCLRSQYGFSDDFIASFMRPWLAGIFLDPSLETSANFFQFVFRMLSAGDISYPADGIQAIPNQLAAKLPTGAVKFHARVERIESGRVFVAEQEPIDASTIVLAVDHASAARLLPAAVSGRGFTQTSCLYFAATKPPIEEPILMLDGDSVQHDPAPGPINHVFVMTNASSTVAPQRQCLISVSLVGEACTADDSAVRQQLIRWFGDEVEQWQQLRRYELPQALPAQPAGFGETCELVSGIDGVLVCGDFTSNASVNGAMRSGRLAAEKIAALQPSK